MPRITKRLLDAAKPPASTERLVWDDELPGFGVRIRPSGARLFVFQWKRDGRTRRMALGRFGPLTVEEARRKALEVAGAVSRGQDPAAERDARKTDLTVSELCERFLAEGAGHLKPASRSLYESAFVRHVEPLVGRRKLRSLTKVDLERMQADIAHGKTARQLEGAKARGRIVVRGGSAIAARVTAYLASALSWAVRCGYLERSPAEGVKIAPAKRRERYLSVEEFERLGRVLAELEAEGASSTFVAATQLLALTGMRRGEVLGLRWSYLDLSAGLIRLPDSKTGAKIVPLTAPAVALLASLPRREGSPFVFPASRGDGPAVGLRKFLAAACARAGLEGVSPHSLRHSLASLAAQGGASLFLLGKALGHADGRTTERYAHHHVDPVAAAIMPAAQRIARALDAGAAGARGDDAAQVVPLQKVAGR